MIDQKKRYYWLKLDEAFFDDETIKYIEEQKDGIYYSNFYLKLCLKSLKSNGKLICLVGEQYIPYDIASLASLTGVDPKIVKHATNLFVELGIVKMLDTGELYLSQIEEFVGSETKAARIKREQRASKSLTCDKEWNLLEYKEREDNEN